jgi:hypothetical protein
MNSDDSEQESSDSEGEEVELGAMMQSATKNKGARAAVSAEVYGRFNEKKAFEPKVIAKSADVKEKIKSRLLQAFMF